MKRFILFILLTLMGTVMGVAQNHSISGTIGYGSFSMRDMKDLQQMFVEDSEIPLKKTDEFPNYILFGLRYQYRIDEKLSVGGFAGFKSTGGRAHYGDYSGEVSINQLLKEYSIGAFAQKEILAIHDWELFIYLNASVGFTNFELISELTLSNQASKESYSFNSIGFSGEPGLGIQRNFSRFMGSFRIGYELNMNGKLYFSENEDAYLQDQNGNPVKAQWSGVRASLGIGYRF